MAELAIHDDAYPGRAMVRLRTTMAAAARAVAALSLPPMLQAWTDGDACRLCFAPDQWLIVSDRLASATLIERCDELLRDRLHLAVDASAALRCVAVEGSGARDLLAMGSGVDWSHDAVPAGRCVRTRLSGLPAIIHAIEASAFDVYIDRSHVYSLGQWLTRAATDPLLPEKR